MGHAERGFEQDQTFFRIRQADAAAVLRLDDGVVIQVGFVAEQLQLDAVLSAD